MSDEELRKVLDAATKGPWWVCEYDAGDHSWYDHNGPCPSIQAPDDEDCAVVHWDGFKQEFWSAANGNQGQIEANAALIAMAPDLAAEVLRLRADARAKDAEIARLWEFVEIADDLMQEVFIAILDSGRIDAIELDVTDQPGTPEDYRLACANVLSALHDALGETP